MSEEYSDDGEECHWNESCSKFPREELSIDTILDIYEDLKEYVEIMGLPILDSPHGGSSLYNTLMWKLGYY